MPKRRPHAYKPMAMSDDGNDPDNAGSGGLSAHARLRIALVLNLSYTVAEL
eukprot:COSAG05_NODE_7396_length_818_cov_0.876217_1_plen_50_part_01